MIEKFKIEIGYNDRNFLYKLVQCYEYKDMPFDLFLKSCQGALHIGFSYYLANKLGVPYKQIYNIIFCQTPISKALELRMFKMINDFILSCDDIIVSFDVQDFDKSTLAYVYATRL